MFKEIKEAVNWMVSQRNKEIGYTSLKNYLDEQGNHLDKLKVIHVAGTNGKGSTTAMLMSCLKEAGYREVTGCKDLAGLDRVVYGTYQE